MHNKTRSVFRSAANLLLSFVVAATFMWGGCVSCEQYFMLPGTQQSCCNKSGQCERPGKNTPKPEKQDCNRLPLQRGEKIHAVPLPAISPVTIAILPELRLPALARLTAFEILLDPSPPDVQALHGTFLI